MEISIKWNVCRICLQEESKTATDPLRPIFQDKDLARQVYDITGVVIKEEDNLPDKVCPRCFNAIKSATNLRFNCRKSDKYLKSVLHRTQSATSLFRVKRKDDDISNSLEDIIEETNEWQSKETTYETSSTGQVQESHNNNCKRKCESDVDLDDSGGGGGNSSIAINSGVRKKHVTKIKKEREREINTTTVHVNNHNSSKPKTNSPNCIIVANKSPKPQSHYSDQHISAMLVEDEQQQLIENEDEELEDHFDKNSAEMNQMSSECSIDTLSIIADERSSTSATPRKLKLKSRSIIDHSNSVVNFEDDSQDNLNSAEGDGDNRPPLDMYFVLNEDDIKKEYIRDKSDNDEDIDSTNTLELINMDEAEFIDDDEEEDEIEIDERSNITYNEHIEYIVDELPENDNVEGEEEDTADDDDGSCTLRSNNIIELKCEETQPSSVCSMPILSPMSQRRKNSYNTHAPVNNYHVCEVCGNGFTSRSLLNYHMRTHRQPKNFECELCFKRFNAACNLTAHMRTHTGEKPFECQYCHRRFTDRSTHIKHERIHTNEKPFNCNMCGKSFSLSTTLKAHEKVHSGEKPFKCDPCKKSFKLPHQLKAHLNTHQHKILAVEQ